MDDCCRPQMEPPEVSGALPISVVAIKRQLCSINETTACQAGPKHRAPLRMDSNNNAFKLCSDLEKAKKLAEISSDEKHLKKYLGSLLALTTKASEDPTSYATLSSILTKHIASLTATFGKCQASAYCTDTTYIYTKLLKTFQLYDPECVYDLYNDWRYTLSSFNSHSRAETFLDCFKRFKKIVQHLQNAENRWTQLMILSILRLYTHDLLPQTVRALQSANGCDFLRVINKIVRHPNNQETRLKSYNTLITSINTETGSIRSFQPNEIVCNGEHYNLADFEIWIDFNVRMKGTSFMAMSPTADKSKDICGFSSARQMGIVSRQNSLYIQTKWTLGTTRDDPKSSTIEILFIFSAHIHLAILNSDLRDAFIIEFAKDVPLGDNGYLAGPYTIDDSDIRETEPKTKMTSGQHTNIEIEKPTESTEAAENQKLETSTRKTISVSRSIEVATSMAKTSDYFAQSSQCHDEDTSRGRLRKTFPKRRIHQIEYEPYRKRIRTDPLKESLLTKTIRSSTTKTESLSSEEQYSLPPAKRTIAVHDQSQRDRENIQLILVAADEVIHQLTNAPPSAATEGRNFSNESEKFSVDETNKINIEKKERCERSLHKPPLKPKSNALRKKRFDKSVWYRKWSIRKYFESISTEPDHVEEVKESNPNEDNDPTEDNDPNEDIDIYYGSVSDVCGHRARYC